MTTSNEDWRELAQQIQEERDPQKMIELVQQLVAKFDEQQALKTSPPKPDTQIGPRSPQA